MGSRHGPLQQEATRQYITQAMKDTVLPASDEHLPLLYDHEESVSDIFTHKIKNDLQLLHACFGSANHGVLLRGIHMCVCLSLREYRLGASELRNPKEKSAVLDIRLLSLIFTASSHY